MQDHRKGGEQPESTELDLIWGAGKIAEVIGRSPRSTFDMLDRGLLPAKKIGSRWVANREKLIAFFNEAAA